MRRIEPLLESIRAHFYDRKQIQPKKEQVHQIFFTDVFPGKVGMHQTQPSQSAARSSETGKFGYHDTIKSADDDAHNLAGPLNEHTNLSVQIKRQLAKGSGNLSRDDGLAMQPLSTKTVKNLQMVFFQAINISANELNSAPVS